MSGYSLAALALVRGLMAAGVDLQWVPLAREGFGVRQLQPSEIPGLLESLQDLPGLQEVASLLDSSVELQDCDIHLVHTMPESWREFFAAGKRNIGFTAWENDCLPPHWLPCLNEAQDIIVPCEHNRQVLHSHPINANVHVLPHVLNPAPPPPQQDEVGALAQALQIPPDHFVFYSIDTWSPRKNLPALMEAFALAFDAHDRVTLVIKTDPMGEGPAPFYARQSTAALFEAERERLAQRLGKVLPAMVLLPYVMLPSGIALLHARGNAYVSASHGEAWGLSVFEAVGQFGQPVITGAYAGVLDYLPADYPGLIPVLMEPVPVWPPSKPIFWPPQRWAVLDRVALVTRMQQVARDDSAIRAASRVVSQYCAEKFSQSSVTQRLLTMLAPTPPTP
jgi:glycosyltransferase involved in cell wall biosynthesis